ncbi:hypothetical protein ACFYY9_18975 [Streptomyces nigra]|uniref:hypothetical protein n=1 Tax=Streptomyces nigra TaxID=1827580 RepID=UPI0030CEB925
MGSAMSFIHHLGVVASDFEASERFYTAALEPLGISPGYRADDVAEYWAFGNDHEITDVITVKGRPGGSFTVPFLCRGSGVRPRA